MRRFCIFLLVSSMLVCSLLGLAHTAFASAPVGKFFSTLEVSPLASTTTTPASAPCVVVNNSTCSPLITAGSPVPYYVPQGTTLQIQGRGWTKHAAIVLYLIPMPDDRASCPSQQTLSSVNVAHSRQSTSDDQGNFTTQLTLSDALKVTTPYIVCASVTSSDQSTSTLLFQINVTSNPQEQTNNPPASNDPGPFSLNLSVIALALALLALLLYIFSPRQPAAPFPSERKNAS